MENVTLDCFIEDRTEENKNLFTREELECIKYNKECIKKIYLLGFIDAKGCYEKKKS